MCRRQVALITGAGQGQGRAHAIRLAEECADIIAIDICTSSIHPAIDYIQADGEALEETKNLVKKTGRRCVRAKADVRVRAELDAAVAAGLQEFGKIDILVANAGIITFHDSSLDISEEVYDLIVDVDQKGVWDTIKATAPAMIAAKNGGSMIITSSAAGIREQAPYAHYVASKHAVVGLMKAFANEFGRWGIRVNTIHPTGARSVGMGSSPSVVRIYQTEPLFQLCGKNIMTDFDAPITGSPEGAVTGLEPEETATAALFLASDDSRYITGVQLAVDAGNTNKP